MSNSSSSEIVLKKLTDLEKSVESLRIYVTFLESKLADIEKDLSLPDDEEDLDDDEYEDPCVYQPPKKIPKY